MTGGGILLQLMGMTHHRAFTLGLFIIYMVIMTGIMIWQGIGMAPDRYAFILLFPTLLFNRTRNFILDWIPFLFILLSYDFLRGFADNLLSRVHYQELINFDLLMFGALPTVVLQQWLFNPNSPAWYDYFFTIIYFLHFALPLTFGYILWLYNRGYFRQFVTGILILSYAGLFTYIIYPAAPPWLAQEKGYIQGVQKILDQTLTAFPQRWDVPTIYHSFNPNQTAAIPSLHAAYPFLIFLFLVKFFKEKGLLFLPYPLIVWFMIVYLGEHYFLDVILGIIYALLSFIVTDQVIHNPRLRPYLLYPFHLLKR